MKSLDKQRLCVLSSCGDPESFVRGGTTLTTFFIDEEREDLNITMSGQTLKAILVALRFFMGLYQCY